MSESLDILKTSARREIDGAASPVEKQQLAQNLDLWRDALKALKFDLQADFQKKRTDSFQTATGAARLAYEQWKCRATKNLQKIDERLVEVKRWIKERNKVTDPSNAKILMEILSEVRAIRIQINGKEAA